MSYSAGDARVAYPLFQEEYGGSIPTSALQLIFSRIGIKYALLLNEQWHSRLPLLSNWQGCFAYGAECNNVMYGIAIWGRPVARSFNGLGYIELRRMAVSDDAPKNTASRMIGWMLREIRKEGTYKKAISYQDTEVHSGIIYKATGWNATRSGKDSWDRPKQGNSRRRLDRQVVGLKIRWEIDL